MSISNPGLQIEKTLHENFSKATGIVIATWYEVATLYNVEDIKTMKHTADNTGVVDREHSVRVTIDGEVAVTTNNSMVDLTEYFCSLDVSAGVGLGYGLNMLLATDFGFGYYVQDDAGVSRAAKKVGGQEIKIEFRIDEAPQAGQRYRMDIIYTKKVAI